MIKILRFKEIFLRLQSYILSRLINNHDLIKLRLITFLIIFSSFGSFAQKKNTWLRRNWTNMVAHYNVYFHAQKILNEQVQDLALVHKDDFTKLIEVYPYSDEAAATSLKPKMEEVMKKTSFVINKKSKSKWVDNSWLLAGKAHFFRGDLFSADENFQFVNSQYADRTISYDAKLWILKTVLRVGKINDAEAIFKTFQRDEKFPTHLQDELNNVAGDIYTKMGLYSEAQKYLEAGLNGTKNKILKYRINFLLAQLYLLTKDYEKARNHFRTVAKMNAPYEFAFQSNIGIVKANALAGKSDTRESRRNLKKMLKDDKNIDYFDQLYFELGNLDYADKNYNKAIKNYQLAAQKASKNPDLKTNAYLIVAKIHYENKNYRLAEKFFDSTALFISEKHPEYEKIKLQQSILSTLINHLITINTQDSLLKLAELPKEKLETEIRKIIEREKEAKKKNDKKAKDEEGPLDVQPVNNTPTTYSGTDQFIFDNQAMLGGEYNEFIKRWGTRKLTDNWRITAIKKDLVLEPDPQDEDTTLTDQDQKDEPKAGTDNTPDELKKYYTGIPFNTKDKELAHKKILESHFEAGKLYNEKLKEYKEAIFHFETANNSYPANVYEAEIYYYLSKCYDALNDALQSQLNKDKLEAKYPGSPYNQVISNLDSSKPSKPISKEKNEKKEVLDAYEKMYSAYIKENYSLVKQIKLEVDSKYAGNAIQAKFDYLYALAVAKTEPIEKFIELLKQIKDNYPGTEIGEQAAYTLEIVENRNKIAKLDPKSIYKYDGSQTHFFAIITEEGQSDRIKNAISNFNIKYFATNNYKSKSFLLGNKDMLSVEIFANKSEALEYYKSFSLNFKEFIPDMAPTVKFFVISTDNIKTLLREMEESTYLTFFEKMYL
ncbi:MAG: tetratricopeptide repeat protein [Bacteroidia bacterium]